MKRNAYNLAIAVLIGFLLTIPFFILEAVNSSVFSDLGFPLALFIWMWVITSIFVLTIKSVFTDLHSRNKTNKYYLFLFLKITLLVILTWSWLDIMHDQWPCFVGVPNCD